MSAPHENPYRDYAIDYAHHANCKPESHGELLAYHPHQSQVHHDKPPDVPFGATGAPQHAAFDQSQHASTAGVVPGPASPAFVHGLPQPIMFPQQHPLLPRHMAHQYSPASLEIPPPPARRGRKRTRAQAEPDDGTGGRNVRPHLPGYPVEVPAEASQTPEILFPTQSAEQVSSSHDYGPQTPMGLQHHHHHRMPSHTTLSSHHGSANSRSPHYGPPSVVGHPGFPPPAPRPKGPKNKFTPADDRLLVELKEIKGLTWKQIAEFFPGRTSGTLQVRYCTRLKVKDVLWPEEMVRFPFYFILLEAD